MQARISDDLAAWLEESFPHGFKQDFIAECIENLHRMIVSKELPPFHIYAAAASMAATQSIAEREKEIEK